MPTILPPDEHLTAGLAAVQKHIDYHEGELAALRALRRQYKDALGIVTGDRVHVEPFPAAIIEVAPPVAAGEEQTFEQILNVMSGRVTQP